MSNKSEQEKIRWAKLKQLRQKNYAYPNDVRLNASAKLVLDSEIIDDLTKAPRYRLAGRIVQARHMGKAAFVHILDSSGKIQIYVKKDAIGDASYEEFKDFDIGDIVEVGGYSFVTKTGEKSLHVETIRLLTKSLIPLPEKWHGLTDVEVRYRQRYVDLIANPEIREVFRIRARIISEIRAFLDARNYLEVETPALHYFTGGTTARPFRTHYNSLGCDVFLRIALELPLKKLVVGGFDRVYEIAKVFRNEGFSKKHNPEFTMLEFYQAYATFEDLMTLTEELYVHLAQEILGKLKFTFGDLEIDLTPPWPRLSMQESIHAVGGVSRDIDLSSLPNLHKVASQAEIKLEEPKDWGRCLEALWGTLVEPKLIQPTFITHHPFSISPLARKNIDNSNVTDRFELIIAGMENANAFSELNDPEDQRARFEEQAKRKAGGDEEAMDIDEDFLRALEYGLPPTAGEGIGLDRLVMLFTNSASIRDVLLFPQLKPEGRDSEGEEKA